MLSSSAAARVIARFLLLLKVRSVLRNFLRFCFPFDLDLMVLQFDLLFTCSFDYFSFHRCFRELPFCFCFVLLFFKNLFLIFCVWFRSVLDTIVMLIFVSSKAKFLKFYRSKKSRSDVKKLYFERGILSLCMNPVESRYIVGNWI